jgi:hypothetical protein
VRAQRPPRHDRRIQLRVAHASDRSSGKHRGAGFDEHVVDDPGLRGGDDVYLLRRQRPGGRNRALKRPALHDVCYDRRAVDANARAAEARERFQRDDGGDGKYGNSADWRPAR